MNSLAMANVHPVDHRVGENELSELQCNKLQNLYFSMGRLQCAKYSSSLEKERWVAYKSHHWEEKGLKLIILSFTINVPMFHY